MFYTICDNIRSLHNVGSIFRTADGAGVDKIFLCGITGKPTDKKASKVSLGAEKIISWEHHWQTWRVVNRLKKDGFYIVGLENYSCHCEEPRHWRGDAAISREERSDDPLRFCPVDYKKFKLPRLPAQAGSKRGVALNLGDKRIVQGIVLIVGNEVSGISLPILKRCDKVIYIPMHGKKESLNVAVAFGIAVYELKSKM